jgi:hypothetical protein
VEPDVVKYNEINRSQYDLIFGTVSMKEFGIILHFQDKMVTIDETILPMRDINKLQGKSMLRALRHNHSIAMEPQSTQDATKCATQILDANYKKQISSQSSETTASTLRMTNRSSYCSFSGNMSHSSTAS